MDQNNYDRGTGLTQTPTPKVTQLVIKYSGGYIQGEKQASYILVGFVVVAIAVSLFLIFGGKGSSDADVQEQKLYPPGSSVLR